jgi:hypothetical protein
MASQTMGDPYGEEFNGLDGVFKPNALERLQGDRLKIHDDRFSATAFALSWLSSLATRTRPQLRKLIQEINPPASEQLNGIIQPCIENPALHVKTRTDVQPVDNIVSRIGINFPSECQLLWHVVVWIEAAVRLELQGLPKHSQSLRFRGPCDFRTHAFDRFKRACILNEYSHHCWEHEPEITLSFEQELQFDRTALLSEFSGACWKFVHDVVNGTASVSFGDGVDLGDMPDYRDAMKILERKSYHRTLEEWYLDAIETAGGDWY